MTAVQPDMRQQSTESVGQRRRTRMEQVIESVASGMGNTMTFLAEIGVPFAIFAVLWVAFGAALIWSQAAWTRLGLGCAACPSSCRASCGCCSCR
jgi:hypothetical protein